MGRRICGLFLRGGPHYKLSGMDSEIIFKSRFISESGRARIGEGDDKGVVLGRGTEDTSRGSSRGGHWRSKNCFDWHLPNTTSSFLFHTTLDRVWDAEYACMCH